MICILSFHFKAYLTEYFGYDSKKVITNFVSYATIIHMWLYPPPNDVTVCFFSIHYDILYKNRNVKLCS
jgi:hypothetical protein